MKIFDFVSKELQIPLLFEFQKIHKVDLVPIAKELIHYPELMNLSGDSIQNLVEFEADPETWILKNLSHERRRFEWGMGRQIALDFWKQGFKELSVSHSAEHILVCATQKNPIGVDFELSSRKIEESVYLRISSAAERQLILNPLSLWTVKEAGFKAARKQLHLMTEVEVLTVSKVKTQEPGQFFSGQIQLGHVSRAPFWLYSDQTWTVSVAIHLRHPPLFL